MNNSSEKDQWVLLREKLNVSYDVSQDWEAGINMFSSRIHARFFTPVENILAFNQKEGEGFAILSTQCALIESLAAYEKGKIYNRKKKGDLPAYEYSGSQDLYVNFLHDASIFENTFYRFRNGEKINDDPFDATHFYIDVRCGLIHEARTKGAWTINVRKEREVTNSFIAFDDGKLKIYRSELHDKLKDYVAEYCAKLKEPANNELRKAFARKFDNAFDIGADPEHFGWWR